MNHPILNIQQLILIAECTNNKLLKTYLKDLVSNHYRLLDDLYDSNDALMNDCHIVSGQMCVHIKETDKTSYVLLNLWYGPFFETRNALCEIPDPVVFILPIEVLDMSELFSAEFRNMLLNKPQYWADIAIDFSFRRFVEVTETDLRQYGKHTTSLDPDKLQVKNSIQEFLKECMTINSMATFDKWKSIPAVVSIESLDDFKYSVGVVVFFPHVEDSFGFTCTISDLSVVYSLFTEENVLMAVMSKTNFSIRINFTI